MKKPAWSTAASTDRETMWRSVAEAMFEALGSPDLDYPPLRAKQIFTGAREINEGFAAKAITAVHALERPAASGTVIKSRAELLQEARALDELAATATSLRDQLLAVNGMEGLASGDEPSEGGRSGARSGVLPAGEPPSPLDPTIALTPKQFMDRLRALYDWRGLSFRALETAATESGARLPRSTLSDALRRDELIPLDLLTTFTAAVGLPFGERLKWEERHLALSGSADDDPAAQPKYPAPSADNEIIVKVDVPPWRRPSVSMQQS